MTNGNRIDRYDSYTLRLTVKELKDLISDLSDNQTVEFRIDGDDIVLELFVYSPAPESAREQFEMFSNQDYLMYLTTQPKPRYIR